MSATANLIQEFKDMKAMPLIEVKGENGEYYVFDVLVNRNYIKASCNTHSMKDVNVRWDTCYSLDEHLQSLLEDIHDKIGYCTED